jgi:hypothetical protein
VVTGTQTTALARDRPPLMLCNCSAPVKIENQSQTSQRPSHQPPAEHQEHPTVTTRSTRS